MSKICPLLSQKEAAFVPCQEGSCAWFGHKLKRCAITELEWLDLISPGA